MNISNLFVSHLMQLKADGKVIPTHEREPENIALLKATIDKFCSNYGFRPPRVSSHYWSIERGVSIETHVYFGDNSLTVITDKGVNVFLPRTNGNSEPVNFCVGF